MWVLAAAKSCFKIVKSDCPDSPFPEHCNGSVRTLAGSGSTDNADPLQAKFFSPGGIISILESGERLIIIAGHYDHRVRVIYANRTVPTLAGHGDVGYMQCDSADNVDPLAARFCHPVGVARDRFGNIIVTDYFGNRIRKVWCNGFQSGVTTIAGNGPTGTSGGNSIDSDNPLAASFFSITYYPAPGCKDCNSHGKCNQSSRMCVCNAGWTGETCNDCATGYFGAQCQACPTCLNGGRCDEGMNGSGMCVCVEP